MVEPPGIELFDGQELAAAAFLPRAALDELEEGRVECRHAGVGSRIDIERAAAFARVIAGLDNAHGRRQMGAGPAIIMTGTGTRSAIAWPPRRSIAI